MFFKNWNNVNIYVPTILIFDHSYVFDLIIHGGYLIIGKTATINYNE